MKGVFDFIFSILVVVMLVIFIFIYLLIFGSHFDVFANVNAEYMDLAYNYKNSNVFLNSRIEYKGYFVPVIDLIYYANKKNSKEIVDIINKTLDEYAKRGVFIAIYLKGEWVGYCGKDMVKYNISNVEIAMCAPAIVIKPFFQYIIPGIK